MKNFSDEYNDLIYCSDMFPKKKNLFYEVMEKYLEEEKKESDVQFFNEYTLLPKVTGIDYKIWLDDEGEDRNVEHHRPRLKVILSKDKKDWIPVFFDKEEPEIALKKGQYNKDIERKVRTTYKFIKKNREVFLKYWYHDIKRENIEELIEKV